MATAVEKTGSRAAKRKTPSASAKAKAKAAVIPIKPKLAADATTKSAAREAEKATEKAAKKTRDERDLIAYETTKFLVPMWFGQSSVEKSLRKQLAPEAALCLMLIGSGTDGQESEVGMQIRVRPSQFDRQEARLLAMMGTASLKGAKLAKRLTDKKYEDMEHVLIPNVLTAKGQKLYDLVKGSILSRV